MAQTPKNAQAAETEKPKKRNRGRKPGVDPTEKTYDQIAAEVSAEMAAKYAKLAQQPETGVGGKYNTPQTRMALLEQDDDKRAFIGKTITNLIEFRFKGLTEPVQNDQEICERLNWYFQRCAETQQLATVEKMCVALGYSTDTVKDWANGRNAGFSPQTKVIIKQAKDLIAAMDADLANEGKINAVTYIFRAKNYYGLSDKQEVVVTPNNPLGDYQDSRIIEAKYDELPE